MRRFRVLFGRLPLAVGAIAVAVFVSVGMAAAPAGASQAGVALLSSTPKTVVLDPATGGVVSVTAGTAATPMISNHNICNTGDGCYFSGRIPYANQGFYGSAGTFNGSWPYRDEW